jgi:hypothetical protein
MTELYVRSRGTAAIRERLSTNGRGALLSLRTETYLFDDRKGSEFSRRSRSLSFLRCDRVVAHVVSRGMWIG